MDKFWLYVESAARLDFAQRKTTVSDLTASIGFALGGKGMREYLDKLRVDYDGT